MFAAVGAMVTQVSWGACFWQATRDSISSSIGMRGDFFMRITFLWVNDQKRLASIDNI
jgi:hypothetical protein